MEIAIFCFSYYLSYDATFTRKGLDAFLLDLLFKVENELESVNFSVRQQQTS